MPILAPTAGVQATIGKKVGQGSGSLYIEAHIENLAVGGSMKNLQSWLMLATMFVLGTCVGLLFKYLAWGL